MLEALSHESFAHLEGSFFNARCGEVTATLELVEARLEKASYAMPGSSRKPFSLLFRGPEGIQFNQGSLELSHPEFPALEIFTTPVGCTGGRYLIQAVFN